VFHPSDHDVDLSEEEFRLLRDFIHERFGIYFEESQKGSLRSRLQGRVKSLDLLSFEDYYHYLRFGPQRTDELQRMISHLTNNETYFFREQPQLQVFADHVLRNVKERKVAVGTEGLPRALRVVSAGCSTGEEPHTLAMIIYDSGQFFWNWDVQVVGLDVDHLALEKARRGVYFHNSFRSLSPVQLERHFVRQGAGAVVKDAIRRMVSLRHGNLVERSSFDGLAPVDVIFCRNVLIYFSEAAFQSAVANFARSLRQGGLLFLGHSESLIGRSDRFETVRLERCIAYRKLHD
jgi:chemotaxis protein methyltransferase CheR